jgi:riboflavin synthase
MFTGIIEGLGTLTAIQPSGQGARLSVASEISLETTGIGDSNAVSGACLTAVTISGNRFEVDVSPETLKQTTLGSARVGDRVNIERALRLGDRLDGHLVSGHIDGTGVLRQRKLLGNAIIITISVPRELTRYMIRKGSVAVDGVSLTINSLGPESFEVSIIPHTAGLTTVGFKQPGSRVNIETDMIGKYVERFLNGVSGADRSHPVQRSTIDQEFLIKSGFID